MSLPPAKEVWGKVIFLEAYVKNSVHGRSALVYAGIPPPTAGTPPGTRHLPRTRYPPGQAPPQTRHPQTRHPLDQAPPPPDQAPPNPPSRACWEIRSVSGRYASYWNAILLPKKVLLFVI